MALMDLYRAIIQEEVERQTMWLIAYVLAQVGGRVTIPFGALLHMPPDLMLVKIPASDGMAVTFELREANGKPWSGSELCTRLAVLDVSKLG